jgi:hypothetical protein
LPIRAALRGNPPAAFSDLFSQDIARWKASIQVDEKSVIE